MDAFLEILKKCLIYLFGEVHDDILIHPRLTPSLSAMHVLFTFLQKSLVFGIFVNNVSLNVKKY